MNRAEGPRPIPGSRALPSAYGGPVEIGVLGPTRLFDGGDAISVGGVKQRTVLALLVASVGDTVTADALIDGVYGDGAARGAPSP